MKKKRLVIARVNSIAFPADKQEELRKKLTKQIKDGVIVIDKSCVIECYDYDSKSIEVKVISNNDKVEFVKKD